ncbi:MAG: YciI family protein [Myxococcaceae bacterium]|nr:YciI family protein [Myxococcaceae bacterium]
MRVMVLVKATKNSEAEVAPGTKDLVEQMGAFNDQLVKAGVLLAGDGLKPSRFGKRYIQNTKQVVDGPFAETKELVAGYWLWQVKSMDEALEWARRCPDCMPGEESVLELRPVYSEEEFAELVK